MKYEARLPNGELIGTVRLPTNGRHYITMSIIQKLSTFATPFDDYDPISSIPVKIVEFELTDLHWKYQNYMKVVPTAILIKGKKTWLRGQSWFRGLR